MSLETPIAFIIFNRPDVTRRVFETIRAQKPKQLFIICDGPRPTREGEAEKVKETQAIVQVDWPCEVKWEIAPQNMGCKMRVASGISWVFSQVEQAIILEDDCLPHPSFFNYASELLEKYKNDSKVMMISGINLGQAPFETTDSYRFTGFPNIWGWATWRRAWNLFDVEMKNWPKMKEARTLDLRFKSPSITKFWEKHFDRTHAGLIDTWDHQWTFTMLYNEGLSCQPSRNLVSNLGFGIAEATHTHRKSKFAEMQTFEMPFPLHHPIVVKRDERADLVIQSKTASLLWRAWDRFTNLF